MPLVMRALLSRVMVFAACSPKARSFFFLSRHDLVKVGGGVFVSPLLPPRPPATRPTSSSVDELISLQRPSPLMNSRVKTLRRSARAKERLVDAALSQGASTSVIPLSFLIVKYLGQQGKLTCVQDTYKKDCREESAEGLARVAQPEPSRKRQIGATSDIDPLPAKRARPTRTNTQRPVVEDDKAEQMVEV